MAERRRGATRGALVEFGAETPLAVRLPMLLPSLLRSEATVAAYFAESAEEDVVLTAQEVADAVGVSRATVIRTCQSLGYRGYPQLRVALARDLTRDDAVSPPAVGSLGSGKAMRGRKSVG